MTARYLSAITGRTITRNQIDDQLLAAVEFIDDTLWCARTAGELGLNRLKLEAPPGAGGIQVRLDVVRLSAQSSRHLRRISGGTHQRRPRKARRSRRRPR